MKRELGIFEKHLQIPMRIKGKKKKLKEWFIEEDSPAVQQAKQMGLVYKGFGRWADTRTNKVTHKSTDGGAKLEPVGTTEPETEKEPTRDPTPGERSHGKKITARNRNVVMDKFQKL